MPPKGSGHWPASESEKQDRDTVVRAVYQVGRNRLRFTAYQILKAVRSDPRLTLHHPGQLNRHLKAITGESILQVGVRNGFGASAANRRGKAVYVLKSREAEFKRALPELDDLEKAYFALWVAVIALGGTEVPTQAVTAVLQSLEELALETPRQTSYLLKQLANREEPLAKIERVAHQTTWWMHAGEAPEHPRLDDWVAAFQAANPDIQAVVSTGKATLSSMVVELVEIALERSKSSTWPHGHPVTISDLEAAAGADPRAAEITHWLRRRGTTAAAVLGDLTKQRIAGGARRVLRPVIKVASPIGSGAYYDVPTPKNEHERRKVFVAFRGVQEAFVAQRMEALEEEYHDAGTLVAHSVPEVAACGAVRVLAVYREIDGMSRELAALEEKTAPLSATIRKTLLEYRADLNRLVDRMPDLTHAEEDAEEALGSVGFSADEVLAAPRPLITADQYKEWFPAYELRGLTPSEFLARAIALRRYPNPAHTHRADSDRAKAAITCVDRADALVYAASRIQSPVLGFLEEGYGLLGPSLRHAGLVEAVLRSGEAALHRAALAALVLLGSPAATCAAWETVQCSKSTLGVIDGLHALLVMRQLDLDRVSPAVAGRSDPHLCDALRQVRLAVFQKRWLLQA